MLRAGRRCERAVSTNALYPLTNTLRDSLCSSQIEVLTQRADGEAFTTNDRTFSSTKLVPNDYVEGIGQLKVVVEFSDGTKYDQQMVVEITTGVAMCWDLDLDGSGESWAAIEPNLPKQLVKGQTNGINIVACNPSDDSIISSVSFFMVTKSEYSGETTEELKTTQYTSPYSINPLIVDSYQFDMDVIISAKVTQTDGKVVGYALPAFVYEVRRGKTRCGKCNGCTWRQVGYCMRGWGKVLARHQ